MIVLETERLYLRQWVPDDRVRFKPLLIDPRVTQYVPQRDWTDEKIESQMREYIQQSQGRGWTLWPVIHRADSKFIGFCGFGEEKTSEVGIGWRFLPEYWGQGLATEAAAATLRLGFAKWRFPRAVAHAQKPNVASIRVMEKIGMTCDGVCDHEGIEVVRYVIGNPYASPGPATKMSSPKEKSDADDSPKQVKLVIVIRHDLKMRRGKQIAQGAHAAMSFICRRLQKAGTVSLDDFTDAQRAWLTGTFAKVCCRVNSEAELAEIHDKALAAGLEVHLITDSGKTEFHDQPTETCLAIGPDDADKIDAITGHLELL
ncbi:MAG: aminoacyl-tRNA hydrolase [Pirellulales bacterium]|nr:aminoacyl-tRNA hydrolase [Pirellulales bacterium]